jgi:hypothetical protein
LENATAPYFGEEDIDMIDIIEMFFVLVSLGIVIVEIVEVRQKC